MQLREISTGQIEFLTENREGIKRNLKRGNRFIYIKECFLYIFINHEFT